MNPNSQTITHELNIEDYSPLIPGKATQLLEQVEAHKKFFPKSVEFFGEILRAHHQKHPNLEDWLIIVHYHFFWDSNHKAIQWFEGLFNESIDLMGLESWNNRIEESIQRTNTPTTHDLCDRLYDITLELFGALYLARQGGKTSFIPRKEDEKKPDVEAIWKEKKVVLECKFVHTSEKYESFALRFITAILKYTRPRFPLLLCEQFRFPSSLKLKALSPVDCLLVKTLIKHVSQKNTSTHVGKFEHGAFIYSYLLPPALVSIDLQYEFAITQSDKFATQYLSRLLEHASLQLKKPEFDDHEKIMFIGLQPDGLYLRPWNENAILYAKTTFIPLAESQGIKAIFSEDVGFNVRGYL